MLLIILHVSATYGGQPGSMHIAHVSTQTSFFLLNAFLNTLHTHSAPLSLWGPSIGFISFSIHVYSLTPPPPTPPYYKPNLNRIHTLVLNVTLDPKTRIPLGGPGIRPHKEQLVPTKDPFSKKWAWKMK